VILRQRHQARDDGLLLGPQDRVARIAQHERIGEVVDVFRSAGEVEELAQPAAGIRGRELLLEEVLDGLHVMVGFALYGLDALRLVQRQAGGERLQQGQGLAFDRLQLDDAGLRGQREQPACLHRDAVANQPEFAENGSQPCGPAGIAAVHRGHGCQGGRFH
jgi:hypothetical protein